MNKCKLTILSYLINYGVKNNLSLSEFLLLAYFDNSYDKVFDINLISKVLEIDEAIILEAFNKLITKKVLTLKSEKDISGKIIDTVSLDGLYQDAVLNEKKNEKQELKEDIFSKFEASFKRPLTGMEIEIIKMWIEKMYTEDLIITALEEAMYNGVCNIRYIDKILHEWNKLGLKNKEDIENHLKNRYDNKKLEETNIFDYNWLDDYVN